MLLKLTQEEIDRQLCIKHRGKGGKQAEPAEKWVRSIEEFSFILLAVEIVRKDIKIPGTL